MDKRIFSGVTFTAITLALILIFSATSFAQKGKGNKGKGGKKKQRVQVEVPADAKPLYGQDFIKKFDFDKDGKVSHEEWEGIKLMTFYANNHFPDFDKNRDGFILLDETPQPK